MPGLPRLSPRNPDSHKGTFGRVLVIGGSRGMAGAPALAGMAALRGGAGLVVIACPEEIAPIVAGFEPCCITLPLPATPDGRFAEPAIARIMSHPADVIAIGPGLGQGSVLVDLLKQLLAKRPKPMVIDADGLNLLARRTMVLKGRKAPTLLTPHPGEFARLVGKTNEEVQADREGLAASFAQEHGVIIVLKGHRTVITDGERVVVNETGNAGMATAGTGDVLTGLIAALLGQGLEPFDAARLGAHLHGLAGDLAARRVGQIALIARDLIDALPEAFRAAHEPATG